MGLEREEIVKSASWSGIIGTLIWAFVATELAYRMNIYLHWESLNAERLSWLLNRPLNAAILISVLLFSIDSGDAKYWIWIPIGSSMVLILPVGDELWKVIAPDGDIFKFNYFSYQWLYAIGIFFPPVLYAMRKVELRDNEK